MKMFTMRAIFTLTLSTLFFHDCYVDAEPIRTPNAGGEGNNWNNGGGINLTDNDLNTCEQQLSKYRRFLLQAIVSFEDVCDAYNARPPLPPAAPSSMADYFYRGMPPSSPSNDLHAASPNVIFRNYQPPERRSEIWAFFKLLMAQFNDISFTQVIRDAVIERCRIKSIQFQHDEKRNSVVLGKKQRFHSWGGKRAVYYLPNGSEQQADSDSDNF